jgi:hypothetical protein
MDNNDPARSVPPAPAELPFGERMAWRNGYRQAIADLLQLEENGGEVVIDGEQVYALTIGRHVIE